MEKDFTLFILENYMISQISHEASADLTQLQITAAIKFLKDNFIGDCAKRDISNIITLANIMSINYQSIHLVKCV